MRLIFCLNCSKLNVDFRNAIKMEKKHFSFLDNFITIGCRRFSLLLVKYFPSAVNMLTNGLKISEITRTGFLQLKFSDSDEQTW